MLCRQREVAQQRQMLVNGLLRASHERLNELTTAPLAPPWLMHPSAAAYIGPSSMAAAPATALPGASPNHSSAMLRPGPGSLTNLATVGLTPAVGPALQLLQPSAVISSS